MSASPLGLQAKRQAIAQAASPFFDAQDDDVLLSVHCDATGHPHALQAPVFKSWLSRMVNCVAHNAITHITENKVYTYLPKAIRT